MRLAGWLRRSAQLETQSVLILTSDGRRLARLRYSEVLPTWPAPQDRGLAVPPLSGTLLMCACVSPPSKLGVESDSSSGTNRHGSGDDPHAQHFRYPETALMPWWRRVARQAGG